MKMVLKPGHGGLKSNGEWVKPGVPFDISAEDAKLVDPTNEKLATPEEFEELKKAEEASKKAKAHREAALKEQAAKEEAEAKKAKADAKGGAK